MKDEIVERIAVLRGQGMTVKKITRPVPLKGMFFRVLLPDANERPVEPVDFKAYDSSIASIIWLQKCEAIAATA